MRALLPAAILAALGAADPAAAQALTIGENDIVSLSGAPEVVSAAARVDAAGRPALDLTMRFPNECYADIGAKVFAMRAGDGPPHAVVTQRVTDTACIEIFQPVERGVTILLPSVMAADEIRLIARSSAGPVQTLQTTIAGAPGENAIAEAETLAGFAPAATDITVAAPESGPGYTVHATLTLDPGCAPDGLSARLFEVPDAEGQPSLDVLFVSAPAGCGGSGTAEIGINVETPQAPAGRSLYVANEAEPLPRPLAP
ncbi:hypothetical protein FQ775_23165 [Nitratireductor mangrovi]|uniref:Uncharacterized protein n=1 Tax=Nitratireductor mangrovi TaxID=2599600 RepID=A0A5B8L5M0_9HYPH|nr:hypothetical protein [Nitratireductor mangrovi]QDZ03033.1 hypothetical protein FQ775_23165 [Nitratireductor mangrovi]